MQTKDKRNQIESWFTTPEPFLRMAEPSKALAKWTGIGFLVCAGVIVTSILMWETGNWPFWKTRGFFEDIVNFVTHLVGGVILVVGGIILFFIALIRIFDYMSSKKKYDAAKAGYDRAKAAYDALPSTAQMVEWLKEDLANQEKSFHDKMIEGYHESTDESNEILLPETLFVWIPEMSKGKTERTQDGYNLCSEWTLNALNISNRAVIIGRWIYDWGENRVLGGDRKQYFYLNIESIGTRSDGIHEVLEINMSGGKHVEFSVEDYLFVDDQGSQGLSSLDRIETSINSRLRDAKNIDRTENTEDN